MSDLVLTVINGLSATLTLNQPAKRNPLSPAMRAALINALENIRTNPLIRAIIITGAGDVFCSGLDLHDLSNEIETASKADALADSEAIRDFYAYLLAYPKPLIAAVNGAAVAGGAGLALVCDLTVLAESATICFSEVKIGFVAAIVGIYLQMSSGFKRARELMLSARIVSAHESLILNLATAVEPDGELLALCEDWANKLSRNAPEAIALTKQLVAQEFNVNTHAMMELAVEMNARVRQSSECRAGVNAFLRKERPPWVYS